MFCGTVASAQVPATEYAARREALGARLRDGVLVALGGREPVLDYEGFNQTSQFLYLTGLREPGAALVLVRQNGRTTPLLFVEPRDPAREAWTGKRLGVEGATAATGVAAYPMGRLRPTLDSLIRTERLAQLYVVGELGGGEGAATADDQYVAALRAAYPKVAVSDGNPVVLRLRGMKSAAELELIRKAVEITAEAQKNAAQLIHPGTKEYEAQALIEYTFRRNGADRPSFTTIVGSGPNSTALHYAAGDRVMQAGEVVVLDIGASWQGYAADVTRTLPVSGTFTAAQREIYQIVRDAQASAERQARVGGAARVMSDSATAVLAVGLTRLGLIERPDARYDCEANGARGECSQYELFYMHGLGHGIGLDVHDPDQYYFSGTLAEGSAFTLEPGLYVRSDVLETLPRTPRNLAFAAKVRSAVERYANIGIRIEDDYLITARGVEWVSRLPRELAEVEAMMRRP
jgi:Xaa-Pro aminopeptidase